MKNKQIVEQLTTKDNSVRLYVYDDESLRLYVRGGYALGNMFVSKQATNVTLLPRSKA
jgi:hypothetical protein